MFEWVVAGRGCTFEPGACDLVGAPAVHLGGADARPSFTNGSAVVSGLGIAHAK
jgi:hypothetical protein